MIDSHCHLHDSEFYPDNREEVYRLSREAGVTMICVGTTVASSREAIEFCMAHEGCYAVIGIHPHDSKDNDPQEIRDLAEAYRGHVVGIGEIGLDYFYEHSPRERQIEALTQQLQIAKDFDLPVSFHVRDAFDDFWPIYDKFAGVRGVLHSFTDTQANLDEGLQRGLYVGINGISTFTKAKNQQMVYREAPLAKILLETDAPFLTPKPFRGKMNMPAYIGRVAEHQALIKQVALDDVVRIATENARTLFGI